MFVNHELMFVKV